MKQDASASRTAVNVAILRALHAEDNEPRIFDDYLAARLVTPEERDDFERMVVAGLERLRAGTAGSDPPHRLREGLRHTTTQSLVLARARFIEDELLRRVARGLSQYIVVGAGLDTFAMRRADLQDRVHVFEIDHPATQQSKRARLAAAGFACPPNLHFLSADLEREGVLDALRRSPYRGDRPAFFSWPGVSYYLSSESIFAVLRSIRRAAAPGSCMVFDYLDSDAFDPRKASKRIRLITERLRRLGEPLITGFEPDRMRGMLASLGFRVVETLGPEEQSSRYFKSRDHGLCSEHFHLVLAEVDEDSRA